MNRVMAVTGKATGKCSFCGKPMMRTKRFTVNPLDEYGKALREAKEKALEWTPDPGVWRHPRCLKDQQLPGQMDIYDVLEA